MRVSTPLLYSLGSDAIMRHQTSLFKSQQQLASGERMLAPADDPVAAAQVLRAGQGTTLDDQYLANQGSARDRLGQSEALLAQAGNVLQDVRTLLVNAGNATLSDADRASLALELQNRFDSLLALANSRDAGGDYVFSGFQGATQPFAASAAGAQYAGDEGVRSLAVAAGRAMPISVSGARVFDRVPTGNGVFAVSAGGANSGSAVSDGGSVANAAQLTGHSYRVLFTVSGGATSYDVLDLTAGTTAVTGASYTSGQAIQFGGIQLGIQGSPANGDQFDIVPSASRSIFATLKGLIGLLQRPVSGAAGRAALGNGLGAGLQEIDQGQERALAARAELGANLSELDALQTLVSSDKLQRQQEISRLGDLDYAQAASQFAQQQTALQAAQQSYVRVAGLSLFNYL